MGVYVFIISLLSVEQTDSIHRLYKLLPVKTGKVVGAKYFEALLITLLGTAISFVLSFVCRWGAVAFHHPFFERMPEMSAVAAGGMIACPMLTTALLLPVVYKLGVIKSRYILIIAWVFLSMAMSTFLSISGENSTAFLNGWYCLGIGIVGLGVLLFASFRLSKRFFLQYD